MNRAFTDATLAMLYHQLSDSKTAIMAELERLVGGPDLANFVKSELQAAKDMTKCTFHNYAKYVNHLITSIQKKVDWHLSDGCKNILMKHLTAF